MKIISLILSLLTLLAAAYFHNISGNGIPGNIINIASAARQSAGELSPVNTGEVSLPVIMYHSVLKDPARTGEYVITPETLESDLKYLSEKGCNAVSPHEIWEFASMGTPLPENPVFITFDDGHLNNLTYGRPLMEKYGMRCTVNVVGAFTLQAEKENDPNPYYAYLTKENIREMLSSGCFDIGCHTYNMHTLGSRKGAAMNRGETAEEYAAVLSGDIARWREAAGVSDTLVYAYPFGFYTEEGFTVLQQEGFRVILTCTEGGNLLSPGNELSDNSGQDIVKLNRYNRPGFVQTDEFMKRIGI